MKDSLDELIKKIRGYSGLSCQELAEYMNVSFATVNRWENGNSAPLKRAQERLFTFCQERHIPLIDFIQEKIEQAANEAAVSDDRILLYHGSKSGLEGKLAPISRRYCDFGAGFYMGTRPEQPLTLICDFPESKFYLVSVRLDGIRTVEVPPNVEWAMLVAYHRGRMEKIKGTAFYHKYSTFAEGKDMVIGSIANDKMFQVLDDFFIGNITDAALTKSLSALELGRQYVAITQKGCDAIRVECEIPVSYLERKYLQELSEKNRAKGIALAGDICKANRRNGKYFDEILDEVERR